MRIRWGSINADSEVINPPREFRVRFHSRLPLCCSPSCRQSHPQPPPRLWAASKLRAPSALCKALRLELSPSRPDRGAAPSWARPAAQLHSPAHDWAQAANTAVPTGAMGPRNTPRAREEARTLTSAGRGLGAPPSAWSVIPGLGVDSLGSLLSSPFSLSFSALSGLDPGSGESEATQLSLHPDLFVRRQPRRVNVVLGEGPVRPGEAVSSSE